jgi:hypothetical protein
VEFIQKVLEKDKRTSEIIKKEDTWMKIHYVIADPEVISSISNRKDAEALNGD